MRISFDLDDTLVPTTERFPTEPPPLWGRLLFPWARQWLRVGAAGLLRELSRGGHDVWVYTTSSRSPVFVRCWFASYGVRLGGVVTAERNLRRLRGTHPDLSRLSEFPPAFGIDLHVDDSLGVVQEGDAHGFSVMRVDPLDPAWDHGVLTAIRQRLG